VAQSGTAQAWNTGLYQRACFLTDIPVQICRSNRFAIESPGVGVLFTMDCYSTVIILERFINGEAHEVSMTSQVRTSIDDIFALENKKSITRQRFQEKINLRHYDLSEFNPEGYEVEVFYIKKGQDTLDYRARIAEICSEGKHTGKHEKFDSGVAEACRNAYQHGNGKDPEKAVTIAYKSTEEDFEVIVSDEGGVLHPDFIPFVLAHRQGLAQPYSFYRFALSGKKLDENAGIGTYVMHAVSDEVSYLTNDKGGLSVKMVISK
jgi:anti-sigma regulatory factor (Ser/Thr protein kinase)